VWGRGGHIRQRGGEKGSVGGKNGRKLIQIPETVKTRKKENDLNGANL